MNIKNKLMPVLLTEKEIESIECLLEKEIESNEDWITNDITEKEKEHWKEEIKFLKEIKLKMSAC